MLAAGRARVEAAGLADRIELREGRAEELTDEDGFDALTFTYLLRYVDDPAAQMRELARVVRPGGTVVCLELSLPRWRTYARLYHAVFRRMAPVAGAIVARRGSAYRYLPDSLDAFPSPDQLAATMRAAGLVDVSYRRLTTGVVALHRGRVPQES